MLTSFLVLFLLLCEIPTGAIFAASNAALMLAQMGNEKEAIKEAGAPHVPGIFSLCSLLQGVVGSPV